MKKFKRILLFLLGSVISSIGTYLNTKTNLGVSASGSIPFITSLITGIKLGTCTYLVHGVLTIIEIILQKKITLKVALQIPTAVVFGFFINLVARNIVFEVDNIYLSILLMVISNTLLALGMLIMIRANIVNTPTNGIVQIMNEKTNMSLGLCKNILDFTMAIITIILSLIFKHKIAGIGVGTIFAVVYIGRCVHVFDKLFKKIGI